MSDSKSRLFMVMLHQTLSFKYRVQTGKSTSTIFGYQNRFQVFIMPSCDFFYHLKYQGKTSGRLLLILRQKINK